MHITVCGEYDREYTFHEIDIGLVKVRGPEKNTFDYFAVIKGYDDMVNVTQKEYARLMGILNERNKLK
jgi:hypothetical protein